MKKGELEIKIANQNIQNLIYVVRGTKVMLDQDLAMLYGVETRGLNQAVQRNINRFPSDFAFKLNKKEWVNLKSQFVTSSWGGRRKLPYVFTEQGVAMLSSVLRSPRAIAVNIEIIRTFIRMREFLNSQKEISKELNELKSFLLKHSRENHQEFQKIWKTIDQLLLSKEDNRKIGFDLS